MRSIQSEMGKVKLWSTQKIIDDCEGQYSNIEIAAFITACAGDNLNTKDNRTHQSNG
jgi:thymidine phosphorylase